MSETRAGVIGGILGGVATALGAGATIALGMWEAGETSQHNSFERSVAESDFVQRFSDRSKENQKDIEFLKERRQKIEAELERINQRILSLSGSGDSSQKVDAFNVRLETIEHKLAEINKRDRVQPVDLGPLQARLNELSSRLDDVQNGIRRQPYDVPAIEEVAAALFENYADLLRGPAGPKGDRGPAGAAGKSVSLEDVIAALPDKAAQRAAAGSSSPAAEAALLPEIVKSGECFDMTKFTPSFGVQFQTGSALCDGNVPVATLSIRHVNGKFQWNVVGGDWHEMNQGSWIKFEELGATFFVTGTDRNAGILTGGTRN